MTRENHMQDPNTIGPHTSRANCAVEVVKALRRYDREITIKLGFIAPGSKHGGQPNLKIWERESGLKIRISGSGCVQTVTVCDVPKHSKRQVLVGVLIERFGAENVRWYTLEIIKLASLGLART